MGNNSKLNEVTLSTESIFKGRVISLQIDTVQLPDGNQATREIIRHPGAVAVLAIHGDKMLVVDQYRQAMGRCELEIPAGKLESGEDPLEAAKRELKEETGYSCNNIKLLHSFYTSPGFADEFIHLYFTDDLESGEMALDEDEFLEMSEITLEEAQGYIQEGRICDAKTVMAVYAWQLYSLTGKLGQ
ncbi:NUDIX hydrolase [Paenibacillus pini]|uniref:ADP-ribose pyrophosphatase n=1 Tax=Paenibacillus pini JCM 16418 TaxID=1236976 RepID=W7YDG3_9BACL|nr:NUDIX hydrolase [Paenibacillus pini]GAF08970.1 ADP-ribose pyrophosphatase [Paenibacillus pini JCM 16418]